MRCEIDWCLPIGTAPTVRSRAWATRALEEPLHHADGGRHHEDPLDVHRLVEDHRPGADSADHGCSGDATALKVQLRHRARAQAHLLDRRTHGEAGGVAGHEETRDAREARAARPGIEDEEVRHRGVGHECLRTVEDPTSLARNGGGAESERVRPRVRLRDTSGSDRGPVSEPRKPLPFLRLAPELAQWTLARCGVGGHGENEPVVSRPVADPLQNRDRRQQVLAGAVPLRRNEDALEPELGAGPPQIGRKDRRRGRVVRCPRPGIRRRTRRRRGAD